MKATIEVSFTRRDGVTVSRTVAMASGDSPFGSREGVEKFKARVKKTALTTINSVLGAPKDPPEVKAGGAGGASTTARPAMQASHHATEG